MTFLVQSLCRGCKHQTCFCFDQFLKPFFTAHPLKKSAKQETPRQLKAAEMGQTGSTVVQLLLAGLPGLKTGGCAHTDIV